MITQVSQRFSPWLKLIKVMVFISFLVMLSVIGLEDYIGFYRNFNIFEKIFYWVSDTFAVHFLAVGIPVFVFIYPVYYKSTTEFIARENDLICYRKGIIRYKLHYSEIKECYKFTYKLFGKKVTALFISTEKGDKPCSLLNITTRRSKKNIKHRLYFDCVDEASSAMADYVIDKVNNCAK